MLAIEISDKLNSVDGETSIKIDLKQLLTISCWILLIAYKPKYNQINYSSDPFEAIN